MGLLNEEYEPVVYVPNVRIKLVSGTLPARLFMVLEQLLRNTQIGKYNMSTVLHACQCAWFFMKHPGWFKQANLNMDDPICEPDYIEPCSVRFKTTPKFIKDPADIVIEGRQPICYIDYREAIFSIMPVPDIDANFLNQPNKRIDYGIAE